jgi:hypothetical protein
VREYKCCKNIYLHCLQNNIVSRDISKNILKEEKENSIHSDVAGIYHMKMSTLGHKKEKIPPL